MKTKGWKNVFSFTFVQYIKTKSFIIGTVVMCIIVAAICVLTNILPAILNDGDDIGNIGEIIGGEPENNPCSALEAVYLFDEPEILTASDKGEFTKLITKGISETDKSPDELIEEFKDSESVKAAVQITAASDENGDILGYNVKTYYSPRTDGDAADIINAVIEEIINRRVLLNAGVSEENYPQTQISITTKKIEAGKDEWSFVQSAMNYFVPIVVSLVLFILIFSYGQVVAQSIATEKTSRVMELLLTSVRPLAVVIGKVLAMGIVSFAQFILIGLVGGLSFALSAPFGWMGKALDIANDPAIRQQLTEGLGDMTSDAEIAQAVSEFTSSFNPLNILLIVIIFLLGFIFFSLIAALVGASVSRMEDLQAAMQPYAIIGVLGMYLAYFPVIFNAGSLESGTASTNPVQIFSYFFPVSSPFALPSAIMLGTLDTWQVLLGIAVLAAAVVLVAIIVGKVYEAIILHNGNRIKMGDILKMAARK